MRHTILETERLELHPLAIEDVDALWPYVSDRELPKLMTWEAHRDRAETEQFVNATIAARAERSAFVWTMRFESKLCGMIGLHDVVHQMRAWKMDRAELGYWCGAEVRSRGLITEAAREVLRYGFEELALHKIIVGCATANGPSKRVIEKLGFRKIGEQRDHFFRDGRWWDHLAYELLISEWEK